MVDSYTPNRNIIKPEVGADSGTWGGLLNNGAFQVIDGLLGATYSTSITAADVTLTTTQFQNFGIVLSGTLTGNRSLILPYQTGTTTVACGGPFLVINNTTGSFRVTVTTQAANATSGVAFAPQGQVSSLYSDGVNVGYTDSGNAATVPASSGSPNSQLAGTAGLANTNASLAADFTNGQLYLCTQSGTAGSAVWTNVSNAQGFDAGRNMNFTATVSANALTVTAIAQSTGTTPAAGSPIVIPFSSASGTTFTGLSSLVSVTSALSITAANGASLGATNGTPFRLWIVGFNNGGAVVLGLINCSNATSIYPINENALATTTAISASAATTGIYYTQGASITGNGAALRVLGFVEYASGLVTAGTYNNAPTATELFGVGTRKPSEVVQTVSPTSGSAVTVTPTSSINLFNVVGAGNVSGISGAGSFQMAASMSARRNNTSISTSSIVVYGSGAGQSIIVPATAALLDNPATTAAITYSMRGGGTNFSSLNQILLTVTELMG